MTSAFWLLLIALPPHANAADLLDILSLAQDNDPAFRAASHRHDAALEQKPQAKARLFPTLSYRYQKTDTDQNIRETQNSVFARGSDSFETVDEGFRLTQSVFDWERWSRFNKSKATVSRADAELSDAQQDLLLRAAEAYIGVLEQGDQLATVGQEKAALERHLEAAKRRAQSGLGRKVDVDDAEARFLIAVAKEIEIQSRLSDRQYALGVLTGRIPAHLQPLRDGLEFAQPVPADPEEWVKRGAQSNPGLIALQFRIDEATREVAARKGGYYPRLDLVLTDGTEDNDGSLFGGGSKIDTDVIALEVNVPIYAGGFNKSRVREARSELMAVEEELLQARRENEREVRDAFQRVMASIAQVSALSRSVEAQNRTLNLKTRGVSSGRYNVLEVLDSVRDLALANQDLTKAKYDYALNILRLKRAAGVLSEEDMVIVNGWLAADNQTGSTTTDRS